MDIEEWRPAVGYEGLYEVSSLGRIRSLKRDGRVSRGYVRTYGGRIMSPVKCSKQGHLHIKLTKDKKYTWISVHCIVLEAFVGPRPHGMEGCHWDGNPSNNRVENLRWDTHLGNMEDKKRHGRILCGEKSATAKLSNEDAEWIRANYIPKHPVFGGLALAKRFRMSVAQVSAIGNKTQRTKDEPTAGHERDSVQQRQEADGRAT